LIRPREVYVGYDFHYGRDREGSMRLLTETGPRLGFSVTIVPGTDSNSRRRRQIMPSGVSSYASTSRFEVFAAIAAPSLASRALANSSKIPNKNTPGLSDRGHWEKMERETGLEPATLSLGS
ncbi:MAG: hypothetical protein HRU02_18925, partial [Myxococcales bacterium]|nr:hypothetical protein [Myxococcales bacterium]